MLFKQMREFHILGLCKQRLKGTLYLTERLLTQLLTQHITASGPSDGKLAEPTAFSSNRRLSCARCGGLCKGTGQRGGCLETQLLRRTWAWSPSSAEAGLDRRCCWTLPVHHMCHGLSPAGSKAS